MPGDCIKGFVNSIRLEIAVRVGYYLNVVMQSLRIQYCHCYEYDSIILLLSMDSIVLTLSSIIQVIGNINV